MTLVAAGADVDRTDEDGNTPLHVAASDNYAGDRIGALLDAGADPAARNAAGETPWELARDNKTLKDSDAYWRLNDLRFETPEQESRRSPARPQRQQGLGSVAPRAEQGPACEIPGCPTPAAVQSLGLNWCGSDVGFERRAFARRRS